jgi:predicted  nucleic acid-binding Zn-ribbon protein
LDILVLPIGQRKIQPYLTFLNVPQLKRQGADIQSKVEELEEINQSLRNRDKLKDDAISQLSDQLVALSTRLEEIERRQQETDMIYYCSRHSDF